MDPFGLAEICNRIIEEKLRWVDRKEKIVGYKESSQSEEILRRLVDALTTKKPGGFLEKGRVPLIQDIELDQLWEVLSLVCVDACTGKETSRTKIREKPTKKYKEKFFNNPREGDPIPVWGVEPAPSPETRWGYGRTYLP